jgi:hypothetical protein
LYNLTIFPTFDTDGISFIGPHQTTKLQQEFQTGDAPSLLDQGK